MSLDRLHDRDADVQQQEVPFVDVLVAQPDRSPGLDAMGVRTDGQNPDLTTSGRVVSGQDVGLPAPSVVAGVVQPRGRKGVELRCLVCGQVFEARRRDRRTCSDRCAHRDKAARRRAREESDGRPCTGCGRTFLGGSVTRRYCHPNCRAQAYRRRQRTRQGSAA